MSVNSIQPIIGNGHSSFDSAVQVASQIYERFDDQNVLERGHGELVKDVPLLSAGHLGDEELIRYIRNIPLKDGFSLTQDEMVLPFTATEFWENFFADGARMSMDDAAEQLNYIIDDKSSWNPTAYNSFTKEPALKMQIVTLRVKMPSNPLKDYLDNLRTSYLMELSKTKWIMVSHNEGSGFIYADSFITEVMWEAYQPTADSEHCVIRNSWKFEWIDQPWLGSGILKDSVTSSILDSTKFVFEEFLPDNIEKYLHLRKSRQDATSRDNQAMQEIMETEMSNMKDYLNKKVANSAGRMNEQLGSLQQQVYMLGLAVIVISAAICCCMCPYLVHLKRKERATRLGLQRAIDASALNDSMAPI